MTTFALYRPANTVLYFVTQQVTVIVIGDRTSVYNVSYDEHNSDAVGSEVRRVELTTECDSRSNGYYNYNKT